MQAKNQECQRGNQKGKEDGWKRKVNVGSGDGRGRPAAKYCALLTLCYVKGCKATVYNVKYVRTCGVYVLLIVYYGVCIQSKWMDGCWVGYWTEPGLLA